MITEPFGPKARYEATALEMQHLPLVILPHPIGQAPHDEIRRIADQSWDEVNFVLTAPHEQVEMAYADATEPRSFARSAFAGTPIRIGDRT